VAASTVTFCIWSAASCSDGNHDLGLQTGADDDPSVLDLSTDASTTSVVPRPPATRATSDRPGSGADAATGPPASGVEVVVAPAGTATPGASLGEALLGVGPQGWTAEPESLPDLGPLTPAEAAAAVGDPEGEAALLATRRLRLAHARRWIAPSGTTATLVGYAFADAEGALAYEVDSYLAIVGGGAKELLGLDAARGFTAEMDGSVLHGRSLRVDERLYLVIVRGSASDAAVADALLEAQRSRLGR
jgi:hypothetical protein